MFVLDKPFQSSLMFGGKARAYLSGVPEAERIAGVDGVYMIQLECYPVIIFTAVIYEFLY